MRDVHDRPLCLERLEALLARAMEQRRRVVDHPVALQVVDRRSLDLEQEPVGGAVDRGADTIVLMAAVWRQLGSSGNRALGAERAMLLEPASYVIPAGFCTRQSAQPERSKGPSRER